MKKVITIGGVTQDVFIMHEPVQMLHLCLKDGKRSFLVYESGRKVELQNLYYHTGGGATNTAASFKKLGFEVAPCCKVGSDQQAEWIIEKLRADKIDTQYIVHDNNLPTAISFILPTEHGDRIPLVYRGATTQLQENDIPLNNFADTDCVYLSSLNGPASQLLLPITHHAKQSNCYVAVNPGTYQFRSGADILCKSLPNIDVLILNAHEAHICLKAIAQQNAELFAAMQEESRLADHENIPTLLRMPLLSSGECFNSIAFFKHILKSGPKIVAITNGKEGVYVAHDKKIYFHPILPAEVVSTLGAGDAFASTFVSWLLKNQSIEDALRAGIINSAAVIQHVGTKTGLLSENEIEKRMKKLDKKKIRIFDF